MVERFLFNRVSFVAFVTAVLLSSPLSVLAAKPTVRMAEPDHTSNEVVDFSIPQDAVNANASQKDGKMTALAEPAVAVLTIFSDPTYTNIQAAYSSISFPGYNIGVHSFVTVRNVSNNNIAVGWFGVAPGKTMSLGTWGNKSEHPGLWYNLETVIINRDGGYSGRVSASYIMTATELSRFNNYVLNHDSHSDVTNNCSTFASGAWNSAVAPSYSLSAGTPNTPKNLANNLKAKFPNYILRGSVPYYYYVYYATGNYGAKKSLYWQW